MRYVSRFKRGFRFNGKTENCEDHVDGGTSDYIDTEFSATCRVTCGGCTPSTSVPTAGPTSTPTSA